MPFQTHRLTNGLQIIGEVLPSSRSVSLGFFVKTGSRDETLAECGVSHFLEHMVFKGTPRRTAFEVNLDFDRIGANYNAYTSEENTVYYASVLPEYLPKALDILADILRPSLRTEDFDTEKQVILEEIKMYDDQPGSVAWDKAKDIYYRGHPLGNSILGTHDTITALTADQMREYFTRRYSTSNMLLSVAGNLDWQAFVGLVEKTTADWFDTPAGPRGLLSAKGPGGVHAVQKDGLSQQHLLCLAESQPAESMLRYTAGTLAVAIGDDSGSRLHWELVDPGLVESANCGIDSSMGSGMFAVTMSCDPTKAAENLGIVQRVLADVQANGLTEVELQQAKNKIASRVVRASERTSGRMRTIAGSWLYNGEYSDPDVELARFDAVDAKSIRQYLDQYPVTALTTIGYGPATTLA